MMMFSSHLVQYCVTGDNISGEGSGLVRLSLQIETASQTVQRSSLPRRGRRGRGGSCQESGKRAGGGCQLSSFLALSRIVL